MQLLVNLALIVIGALSGVAIAVILDRPVAGIPPAVAGIWLAWRNHNRAAAERQIETAHEPVSWRWPALATVVVIVGLVIVVAWSRPDRPEGPTGSLTPLTGTVTLHNEAYDSDKPTGTSCTGQGGHDNMVQGAPVVIRNGGGLAGKQGKVLQVGELSAGTQVHLQDTCVFTFRLLVPNDIDFYTVEVSERGEQLFSGTELAASGWHVELALWP